MKSGPSSMSSPAYLSDHSHPRSHSSLAFLPASLMCLDLFCPRAFAGVPSAWGDLPHLLSIPPCHPCSSQSLPGNFPNLHPCRPYGTHLRYPTLPQVKASLLRFKICPRKLPTISKVPKTTSAELTLASPVPQEQQSSENTWEAA